MYCRKCGHENVEHAKFCANCGEPTGPVRERVPAETRPDQNGKKWAFIAAGTILTAAVVVAVCVAGKKISTKKTYDSYMTKASKYLEEMEYEKAEEEYLKAIAVAPKEAESYAGLADVYTAMEEPEKAKAIVQEGQARAEGKKQKTQLEKKEEEISGKDGQNDREDSRKEGEERTYRWAVKPSLEADDIFYVTESDGKGQDGKEQPVNDMRKQFMSPYAVIEKDGKLGLIGMDGKLKEDIEYQEICQEDGEYLLKKEEPEEDRVKEEEEKEKEESRPMTVTDDDRKPQVYYWYEEKLHYSQENSRENAEDSEKSMDVPQHGIPVQEAKKTAQETKPETKPEMEQGTKPETKPEMEQGTKPGMEAWDWSQELDGKFAVYAKDRLVTDFIYEECGSSSDGLMAVKKDGKWGYVDESGKVVIPIQYQESWEHYIPYGEMETEEAEKEEAEKVEETEKVEAEKEETEKVEEAETGGTDAYRPYCYAASDGYVVVVKDQKYELRDVKGEEVIPAGKFEQICPVYEGKCWVKQGGKWGVLQIEEKQEGQK